MEKNRFIILPAEFVEKYQHQKLGVNMFNAIKTKHGDWVASENALKDFSEWFEGHNFETVDLDDSSFDIKTTPQMPNQVIKQS